MRLGLDWVLARLVRGGWRGMSHVVGAVAGAAIVAAGVDGTRRVDSR